MESEGKSLAVIKVHQEIKHRKIQLIARLGLLISIGVFVIMAAYESFPLLATIIGLCCILPGAFGFILVPGMEQR